MGTIKWASIICSSFGGTEKTPGAGVFRYDLNGQLSPPPRTRPAASQWIESAGRFFISAAPFQDVWRVFVYLSTQGRQVIKPRLIH